MSYRLTDVTDLPQSPQALLTLVHPQSAVDIVSRILSPYTSASDPIENLDPNQRPDELLEQLTTGERVLFDASGTSAGIFTARRPEADALVANLPPRLSQAITDRGSVGGISQSAPIKSDSLAPAIEPAYQSPPPARHAGPEQGTRTLDLL